MNDVILLVKKVLVGIVIAAVPLSLMVSGLWLTRHVLEHPAAKQSAVGKDGK